MLAVSAPHDQSPDVCAVDARNAELEFMFHFEGDVDASGQWIDEGTSRLDCLELEN